MQRYACEELAQEAQHIGNYVPSVIFAPQISPDSIIKPYESKLSTAFRFNRMLQAELFNRLSCKERREDALALRADERRDKLRKAAVRSKYPVTRRCLNGETRRSKPPSPYTESIGIRREPGELKHLSSRRKRKKTIDFVSSGERKRKSPNQNACILGFGLHTLRVRLAERSWKDRPERVKAP